MEKLRCCSVFVSKNGSRLLRYARLHKTRLPCTTREPSRLMLFCACAKIFPRGSLALCVISKNELLDVSFSTSTYRRRVACEDERRSRRHLPLRSAGNFDGGNCVQMKIADLERQSESQRLEISRKLVVTRKRGTRFCRFYASIQ